MTLTDFNQFKKLMTLTISDNEAEALASIRAANKLITRNGLTWVMVLDRVCKVVEDITPVGDPDDDFRDSLEIAVRSSTGETHRAMLSIQENWEEKGYVSPRQRAYVAAVANRTPTPRR